MFDKILFRVQSTSNENLESKIAYKNDLRNTETRKEEMKMRSLEFPHTERKVILDLYNSKPINLFKSQPNI